jgi:endonuclease I
MKLHLLSFLALASATSAQETAALSSSDINYLDCATDTYYSGLVGDPSDWSRQDLNLLLKATHRTTLAFTNQTKAGVGDVWAALADMDRGEGNDTVRLTYLNEDISAIPFGIRHWIKEHLFPILKGIGVQGKDFTDIHNLRPSNPLVDFVRRDSFFGVCNVLVRADTCVQPAEGGAADTCACNRLFEPPNAFKGQIARALMYMDLRYDGSDPDTLDLRLTDCPFDRERDMAYLSQMITWHFQYPPEPRELYRNQRACERWQGNRNPFIDHPGLVSNLFSPPKRLPAVGERLIYAECEDIPTLAPTFSPNECEGFNPGDVVFFMINSEDPDNVGLFSFVDLPAGFELFLTDKAWDGKKFLDPRMDGQGTVKVCDVTCLAHCPCFIYCLSICDFIYPSMY